MPVFSMLWALALSFVSSVVGAAPDASAFGAYSKNVAGIKEAAGTYQPPPAPVVDPALVDHPVESGSDVLARWRLDHGPVEMPGSAPAETHPQVVAASSEGPGKISVAKDEQDVRSSLKNWRVQQLHEAMQNMTETPVITANSSTSPAWQAPSVVDVESGSEALDQWSERKKFEAKAAAGIKKAAEDKAKRAAEAEKAAPPSSLFPTNEEVTPTKHVDIAKDLADMHHAVHSDKSDEIHKALSSMRSSSATESTQSQPALLTGSASVDHNLDQKAVSQGNDVLQQWRLSHQVHKDDSKDDSSENHDASSTSQQAAPSKHRHHNTPAEDAADMKATMDEWKHASKKAELHETMHAMGANINDVKPEPEFSSPSANEAADGASVLSDWKNSHRTLADDAVDLHTSLEDAKAEVPATPKRQIAKPHREVPTVPPELLKAKTEDDVQGMGDAFKAFQRARMHENMQNMGEGVDELSKKVASHAADNHEQVTDGEKGGDELKKWQLHKKIEKMMPGVSSDTAQESKIVSEAPSLTMSAHHDATQEDADVGEVSSSKPKKRSLSNDAAAMHASMKEWATQQIHEKLQDMKAASDTSEAAVPVPPDTRGPQVAQDHVFINATEKSDGSDLLKQWTEEHKVEMEARNAAAAKAAGQPLVVQVGAENGVADSDADSSPEAKAAQDVRNAMEAWTSKNVHKVHEQASAMKFLKSKLNEIAHSDMTATGESSALSVTHKSHSISDDLADMHNAVREWNVSSIHQFMRGNLEEVTAAAKQAALKASATGQVSEKPQVNAEQSGEGASILDSYMQGHDPTEFREMEKSQKHTASLAESPSQPSIKKVRRVPPGRFRWRGF
jgi:hypothetical protein